MNVQHGFRSKENELNLSEDRPLQIENESKKERHQCNGGTWYVLTAHNYSCIQTADSIFKA